MIGIRFELIMILLNRPYTVWFVEYILLSVFIIFFNINFLIGLINYVLILLLFVSSSIVIIFYNVQLWHIIIIVNQMLFKKYLHFVIFDIVDAVVIINFCLLLDGLLSTLRIKNLTINLTKTFIKWFIIPFQALILNNLIDLEIWFTYNVLTFFSLLNLIE